MPEAVPVDTLIEYNRIIDPSLGVFTTGDYTRISENRITEGQGEAPIGIRAGFPGGRTPVGTQILGNSVEHFTIGIDVLAEDALVAYNHVCNNHRFGIWVERDNNVIEANEVTDTVGHEDTSGLAVFAKGNLIIRNSLKGNRPFDLVVQNPTENDLVENRCKRSCPPNLCRGWHGDKHRHGGRG